MAERMSNSYKTNRGHTHVFSYSAWRALESEKKIIYIMYTALFQRTWGKNTVELKVSRAG